jgi:hypothetical protein
LVERKKILREIVPKQSRSVLYAKHLPRRGRELFAAVCEQDLKASSPNGRTRQRPGCPPVRLIEPARGQRTKMLLAVPGSERISHNRLTENEDFVPLTGVVHLGTTLGVFLDIQDRRVFVPANCTAAPTQAFEVGEPATILVLRRFAEQERLIR